MTIGNRLVAAIISAGSLFTASASAQVTSDRLVNAARDPQQWLMYSGAYDGTRYTALDQVNKTNVQRLGTLRVLQGCAVDNHFEGVAPS